MGHYVVANSGFVPRRDFHAKMAMLLNQAERLSGMVVGSGNFSSNGLRKSVEAGASVLTHGIDEFDAMLAQPSLPPITSGTGDTCWRHPRCVRGAMECLLFPAGRGEPARRRSRPGRDTCLLDRSRIRH